MKKLNLLLFVIIIVSNISFSQEFQASSLLELRTKLTTEAPSQTNLIVKEILPSETKTKKNAGLAIIYSLLLPGMGELYADNYSSGKYFTIAEGALWATFIGMNVYGNWQENRYKTYAQTYAGVNPDGKDEDYYATIGLYTSIETYNNEKALERRYDEMLSEQKFFWKWNSTEQRKTYRSMWTSSEQTFNDVRFVVGAMLVNRLISAINAVRSVSSYNSELEKEVSWNVSLGLDRDFLNQEIYKINFQTSF
ncbi:Hypothetical protein IALB_1059 [Ignavibacterium album JCM 16511]|uniref:Uncharacterized protein n=1 Tax=Ignavibacterium album (strain DSM 19864 / JCM 16511 / NBRC 101810 / Mat9-16) TaxID=945713 RepID=I0AIG3_IGNAJ|nr:hypothetical protein [Ignavibacterium album]AFH48770.1 Hypothetical protein IALB_1059 [Ignavibacterium album JCM 16511]